MHYSILFLLTVFLFSGKALTAQSFNTDSLRIDYNLLGEGNFNEKPEFDIYLTGITGYQQLVREGKVRKDKFLTLIDFRKSSNEKRMWVIDMKTHKIRYHTLVAHGRNSGELYASRFSNTPESNQSSLGFYRTGAIYTGKHGTSLKLHGLEKGINDRAEQRAIVMHSAEYVSKKFIEKAGRLGRSFGCPAIPVENHDEIINLLADGSCLFIYYPSREYVAKGIPARINNYFTVAPNEHSNGSSNK